jgi:hypothetical protein
LENGDLLRLAEEKYDLFVTSDQDIDGRKTCISRFDSAHSEDPPHRDILGLRSGLRHKEFYEGLDYGDAVKYAIDEFKEYGSDYYQDFLRH